MQITEAVIVWTTLLKPKISSLHRDGSLLKK